MWAPQDEMCLHPARPSPGGMSFPPWSHLDQSQLPQAVRGSRASWGQGCLLSRRSHREPFFEKQAQSHLEHGSGGTRTRSSVPSNPRNSQGGRVTPTVPEWAGPCQKASSPQAPLWGQVTGPPLLAGALGHVPICCQSWAPRCPGDPARAIHPRVPGPCLSLPDPPHPQGPTSEQESPQPLSP